MRFLGVTETCDLGALYMRLLAEGHEVRVSVSEELAEGTLAGLVPRTDDWRRELDWVRDAGDDGIVIFEAVSEGYGALQDSLRKDGLSVIGGSDYGDRLENDRAYAQSVLAELGLQVAATHEFSDVALANDFLVANPGRYVLKFSGPGFASGDNYIGQASDGRDVRAVLAARMRGRAGGTRFVLMEHVDGIEMGVGAYFDGERFLTPACLDWEHKRFFAGDMGELTGEMGTVATFERSRRFFERTLLPIEPLLRDGGYLGYVNLNTIVNEGGIWPLEFTCRFGYPGFAVLDPIQATPWSELFRIMVTRAKNSFEARPGLSVGIVLTTPPFPYTREQVAEPVGLPVIVDADEAQRRHLHYGEVGLEAGQLVTSGMFGWTMVVTGVGPDVAAAKERAYALAARIFTPNLRYRLDIGDRLIAGDFSRLERLGLLDEPDAAAAPIAAPPA